MDRKSHFSLYLVCFNVDNYTEDELKEWGMDMSSTE